MYNFDKTIKIYIPQLLLSSTEDISQRCRSPSVSLYRKEQFLTNSSFEFFFLDKLTIIELCITVQKGKLSCTADKQVEYWKIKCSTIHFFSSFFITLCTLTQQDFVNIVYFLWKEAAVKAPETYWGGKTARTTSESLNTTHPSVWERWNTQQ